MTSTATQTYASNATTASRFTLIVGPGGMPWRRAAEVLHFPVDVQQISGPEWATSYGMLSSGAILIGPDGSVVLRERGINVCIAPPELALLGAASVARRVSEGERG